MARKRTHQEIRFTLRREMASPTRQLAEHVENLQLTVALGRVLVDYYIGTRMRVAHTEEGRYGSAALKQIAKYTNYPGGFSALFSLMNFAKAFDRKFIKAAVQQPMANGRYLETGHFCAVARVSDPVRQLELLDRVRADCLSVRQIETLISERSRHSHHLQ
jgi:hypothetical protein